MKDWHCIWGYEALDFAAFPVTLEGREQRTEIYNFPRADAFRIRFQNTYGTEPLPIAEARLTVWDDGYGEGVPVTVGGQSAFAVEPGEAVWSDPVECAANRGQRFMITLVFERRCRAASGCTFLENDMTRVSHVRMGTDEPVIIDDAFTKKHAAHRYVFGFDRVAVMTEEPVRTVAAFGDSITHHSLWTAPLAARLLERYDGQVVLMNCGICGNRVLHDASTGTGNGPWYGEKGVERFEKDVFDNGFAADSVILLEGVNDIMHPAGGEAPPEEFVTAEELEGALETCAGIAHRHGAKIYACTLMPFNGFKDHWRPWLEEKRVRVNDMLKASAAFDGLIDFDACSRDPHDATRLDPAGKSGDCLHPGVDGGRTMAEHIDLDFFK